MRNIEDRRHKIYVHINKINGKIYIGQTGNTLEHRTGTEGNGYKNCTIFYQAIQEYGWDNFEHIILIDNLTKEEVDLVEGELIQKYNSTNPQYGYNSSPGINKHNDKDQKVNRARIRSSDKKGNVIYKWATNETISDVKKVFTTSIDTEIGRYFKESCTNYGLKMNVVLEAFMKQFSDNEFAIKITKNGIRLEIEEK